MQTQETRTLDSASVIPCPAQPDRQAMPGTICGADNAPQQATGGASREYGFHPLADLFPVLPDSELAKLAKDIRANGLQEPICLYQGQVLDGRSRYKACALAGVTPLFCEYSGDDPAGYVFSMNFYRRHLSPSQRAALAVTFLPLLARQAKERQRQHGGTAPGRSWNTCGNRATSDSGTPAAGADCGKARDIAARMACVSSRYISDATMLQQNAPDLLKAVQSGSQTIPGAMWLLGERRKAQQPKPDGNGTEALIPDGLPILVLVRRNGSRTCTEVISGLGTPTTVAQALSRVCTGLRRGTISLKALPQDASTAKDTAKLIADHFKPVPAATAPQHESQESA